MPFLKGLPTAVGDIVSHYEPLQLIKAWKTAAGPVFEKQAEFRGVRQEGSKVLLLLEVRDPIWRQELQFESERLLKVLAKELAKYSWDPSKIPTEISFQSSRGHLPLKSRNAQFRRNKKMV